MSILQERGSIYAVELQRVGILRKENILVWNKNTEFQAFEFSHLGHRILVEEAAVEASRRENTAKVCGLWQDFSPPETSDSLFIK